METLQLIVGFISGIIILVGLYYLFKILIAYIGHALLWAVIFGLVVCIVSSYVAKDYWLESTIVGAGIGAVFGLVKAIMRTKDIVKADFAKGIVKKMTKTDPNGTTYTVSDQYGNKKTVKKTGSGVLGESYYEDSKGNSYERSYGSDELK